MSLGGGKRKRLYIVRIGPKGRKISDPENEPGLYVSLVGASNEMHSTLHLDTISTRPASSLPQKDSAEDSKTVVAQIFTDMARHRHVLAAACDSADPGAVLANAE
jgi:hypothetical protein